MGRIFVGLGRGREGRGAEVYVSGCEKGGQGRGGRKEGRSPGYTDGTRRHADDTHPLTRTHTHTDDTHPHTPFQTDRHHILQ